MTVSESAQTSGGGEHGQVVNVHFTARTLVAVTVVLLVAIGVYAAFRSGVTALTQIGIGLVFAIALDPLVSVVERRGLGRRAAAAVVGGGLALCGVALVLLVGPAAIDQAQTFERDLPETVEGFYDLPVVGSWLEDNDAKDKVVEFVDDLPSRLDDTSIADTANRLIGGAVSTAVVLTVAFSVMLDGKRLVGLVRDLIPTRHRARADHYARILYDTFGNYFGGSLTVAALMGVFVLVLALAFGVPLAPIAAIWAMFTDLIPQIGGFLGGAFLTILALSTSVTTAVIVALLFVLYMNFENHVIQPAIIGEAVDLTPPSTMLAALIGGAAGGVPGALVATPLVGAGKRLYQELRHPGEQRPSTEHRGFLDRLKGVFHRGSGDDDGDGDDRGS